LVTLVKIMLTRSAPSGRGFSLTAAGNGSRYGVIKAERGGPFTSDAVNWVIKRIGERAGFAFPVHCHMLRHACGYALANAGHDTRALQDWLGHRSIQHTVRYTAPSPTRFQDFWR
jgi:site-specific recombinase XerD